MLNTKDIDNQAAELLKNVFGNIDTLKLPVDLNKVAQYCNLNVRQGTFKDATLEGALDRASRTIYLSEDDTFEGKNFAMAHEIAHLKLHEGVKTDLFYMHQLKELLNADENDSSAESEADHFAASLLVPESILKSLWAVNKNIESLAKIFGVPEIVLRYRIKVLKLA